ncbi:hypothetical protein BKA70DRAFT_1318827 [Coprinopsis sp. MPI-PUGE-AT-0042]|nr:hypothetical protein BKA70DRAFT_1318827 [Coprinopsis sp. MPI-PUGE-AT-0042]
MPFQTRLVTLDSISPSLRYTGLWETESDPWAYHGTVQTTTATSGSMMTFEFLGTLITLNGRAKWGDGEPRPNATCIVDGTNINTTITSDYLACQWSGEESADGGRPHTFRIDVDIPQGSNDSAPAASVSIDSVWYLPSPDSGPLEDRKAEVMYPNNDPHIHYLSGDWRPSDTSEHAAVATKPGSSVTVLFTGTQLIWMTPVWIPSGFGSERSTAQYWIDGGEPGTFILTPPSESDPADNDLKVEGLTEGVAHNLTVVYNGPSFPLTLEVLMVQGGDFRVEAEWPQLASSGNISAGAIAGCVVGGVAVVTLVLLAFFLARRRRRRKKTNNDIASSNSTKLPDPVASPPTSSSTADPVVQTPQPTRLLTDTTSPTPPIAAIDQPAQNDTMTLQVREGTDAPLVAGPCTTPEVPPTSLQAHGVMTNGDIALAARDVHMHKHSHFYHYGVPATEINPQTIHTRAHDGVTTDHMLYPHGDNRYLLNEPYAIQQTPDSNDSVPPMDH